MSHSSEYDPSKVSRELHELAASLGGAAKAMLGETVIVGGFLNTEILKAGSILAEKLDVTDLSAISGKFSG